MNTFGRKLRLTTFGESHGKAMGGVIDGFPPGFKIDFKKLQEELDARRPGTSSLVSTRREEDIPEFLSGINNEGITLGTPIGFIIRNKDQRPSDYSGLENLYRPNHADYTYQKKYGLRDSRGGGRASARETVNWVTAGALALQWLDTKGIEIKTFLSQVGSISNNKIFEDLFNNCSSSTFFEINDEFLKEMENEISKAKSRGDSVGGKVSCIVTGLKAGIGEPVADKLQARLAQAMMSINGAKGFEYGIGFKAVESFGSETADHFLPNEHEIEELKTNTNFSGGIQGGISNGMPIFFSVSFKPTPTIMIPQPTVNCQGKECIMKAKGRHDPCIALRALSVVKSMTALVIADFLL